MLPVGMLLTWAGYSVSLWGWCLLRGYDVTLGQLMSPVHPYGSGKGQPWPPAPIPDSQVFPGGAGAGGHPVVPLGSAVGASVAQGVQIITGQAGSRPPAQASPLKPRP